MRQQQQLSSEGGVSNSGAMVAVCSVLNVVDCILVLSAFLWFGIDGGGGGSGSSDPGWQFSVVFATQLAAVAGSGTPIPYISPVINAMAIYIEHRTGVTNISHIVILAAFTLMSVIRAVFVLYHRCSFGAGSSNRRRRGYRDD